MWVQVLITAFLSAMVVVNGDNGTSDEVKCDIFADIIFVIDSSNSIGIWNYIEQLVFLGHLTQDFGEKTHFAAVRYSYLPKELFRLDSYDDSRSLLSALTSARYVYSSDTVHRALNLILYRHLFGTEQGGREGAKKIILIILDDQLERYGRTVRVAKQLRDKEVQFVAIGIDRARRCQLVKMTNCEQQVIMVETMKHTHTVRSEIVNLICNGLDKCSSP